MVDNLLQTRPRHEVLLAVRRARKDIQAREELDREDITTVLSDDLHENNWSDIPGPPSTPRPSLKPKRPSAASQVTTFDTSRLLSPNPKARRSDLNFTLSMPPDRLHVSGIRRKFVQSMKAAGLSTAKDRYGQVLSELFHVMDCLTHRYTTEDFLEVHYGNFMTLRMFSPTLTIADDYLSCQQD
ncbi:hypothetical protein LX36DRAFT_717103 [Colletotrichum falcatum]|nr:hypothetical protein LX36DRAFT_717103 [Colletotrichum falcatum]